VLAPLGLGAGFLDAVGGGGWGPVGTPTLLASGRLEPRKVIGSVDAGEFLVALGASIGFLISLTWKDIPLATVLLLLSGGLVAAPLAAYLVRRLSPRKLGVIVGAAILLTNARTLMTTFGIEGLARSAAYLGIIVSGRRRRGLAAVAGAQPAPRQAGRRGAGPARARRRAGRLSGPRRAASGVLRWGGNRGAVARRVRAVRALTVIFRVQALPFRAGLARLSDHALLADVLLERL
jgi:hypothetical protein